MNVRAGLAITDSLDLNLALMYVLDRTYRIHGSGVDAAAAVVDIGILSLPILSALALLGFIGISTWLSHLLWPSFRRFRQHHFEHHFTTLEPWQKIAFYMAGFFLLLYACIACLAALL